MEVLNSRIESHSKHKRAKNYVSLVIRFMLESALHSQGDWYCVPKTTMRQWTGCGYHTNADEVIKDLLNWGLLLTDGIYRTSKQGYSRGIKREPKCLGYRVHPDLLDGDYISIPYAEFDWGTTRQRIAKLKRQYPEFRHSINYFTSLEVDLNGVLGYLRDNIGADIKPKTIKRAITDQSGHKVEISRLIQRTLTPEIANHWLYSALALMLGFYNFTRSEVNDRVFSNITSFPSKLRRYLKFNDQFQVELDVANCQPSLLCLLNGFSDPAYKTAVESGLFYEMMAETLGLQRAIVKIRFMKEFLFVKQGRRLNESSAVVKYMAANYPGAKKFVDGVMAEGRHLAIELQKLEAEIMVDGVLKGLMAQGIQCATIHDGMLCKPEDAETGKAVMEITFQARGLNVNVTSKSIIEFETAG